MRKTSALDPLISRMMQAVLSATLLQPERWWYLTDLAKYLGRRPSSLQAPLGALVKAGILQRRKEGNRVYFQADPDCPYLADLRGVLAKTVGLVDVLREALTSFMDRIRVAFVYGSVAKSRELSTSDVDLMIIGRVGLADLSSGLRRAEERLNRPVNATVYTPGEFSKKIASGSHFVTAVLNEEKLFVAGDENDLAKVIGRRSGRTARHEQRRAG